MQVENAGLHVRILVINKVATPYLPNVRIEDIIDKDDNLILQHESPVQMKACMMQRKGPRKSQGVAKSNQLLQRDVVRHLMTAGRRN